MKAYEFEVENQRNTQREELFILTVVERVLAGHLQSISFVDQAQFCELLTKRQKEKKVIQALHLQILGTVKRNLIKNQTPLIEKKVPYEIRTIASSSIDMRKNYIHTFSNRNLQNKEQQTTEIEPQMIGPQQQQSNRNKNLNLDKTYNSGFAKYHTNRSQKQNDSSARYINPFQLNSPNSTQAENILKEFPSLKQSTINENTQVFKNEKAIINIVSQDGQIEQQEGFIIKNNNNNINGQNIVDNKTDENLKIRNQELQVNINPQQIQKIEQQDISYMQQSQRFQSHSRQLSQNLPMGSDSSKMDLKEKLQKYYSNDEDFSSQRRPMTQSDRLKNISYGTDPNTKEIQAENQQQIIQSAKFLDNDKKSHKSQQQQSQQVKFSFISGKTQEIVPHTDKLYKDQITQKKSLDEMYPSGNFLSPPQSARSIISAKSTKTKLKTLQSNDQKLLEQLNFQEQQQENTISKEESQISLLEQSLNQTEQNHHLNSNTLRPATTHIESNKQQDYPMFQTHDNLDLMKKSTQKLLQQQASITSIMHDEENFQNNQTFTQQINIQVNQCEPTQPTNNVIIEESIEGSPNYKIPNIQHSAASFSLLNLVDQKQMPTQTNLQQKIPQSPKNGYLPSNSYIPTSNMIQGNQSQQKMLIPINNTQSSIKHNRATNKSRSQIKDQIQQQSQQQRSEDSQPESKLTIESSQGDKSNRSKIVKNTKQLKLPAAAVALNFARRKSSNQISPMDPKTLEQQEKEKQRQIEYQKQLEKMKYERELMEQFKIPDDMPLLQKRAIIEQLMKELEVNPDQDAKYQIMLYKQRQEQIQNASKFELVFNKNLSNCYEEISHISEQKLKLLGKDVDPSKIQFLKFEDQLQTNFQGQSKSFTQDLNSPIKKNLKFFSKLDPVEIENQMNRMKEFKQETEILKFFSSFNNQYEKEVNQCDLDYPTQKDRYSSMDFQRGFLPKTIHRRKKAKKKSTKIVINTYRMDPKKIDQVLAETEKIKQVGQFLI